MEKSTKVFTVLNEDKMTIAQQTIALNNGLDKHVMTAIFETEQQADRWASERLEMWTVVKSHFNHKWINHRQNIRPELLSCELGKSIDTESKTITVDIRFAKWVMTFEWTINLKSNWVHTNMEPVLSDDHDGKDKWLLAPIFTENDAQVIMEHFDFESCVDLFGEAIENRMIPIC